MSRFCLEPDLLNIFTEYMKYNDIEDGVRVLDVWESFIEFSLLDNSLLDLHIQL
jgi:hypothetical protein